MDRHLAPALLYFYRKNDSLLRLERPRFEWLALRRAVTNGSSEFMSNISMSLVGMLYNMQLLSYAGENGKPSREAGRDLKDRGCTPAPYGRAQAAMAPLVHGRFKKTPHGPDASFPTLREAAL